MSRKNEGTIAIVAALLVLLSAMWDPRISAAIAIVALLAFGVSRLALKEK